MSTEVSELKAGDVAHSYSDRETIIIAYNKDHVGKKHITEGTTLSLHPLHAKALKERGIVKK